MRGEHNDHSFLLWFSWGSSPHARGALRKPGGYRHRCGIIPACAGSTGSHLVHLRQGEDHPRMRGEHALTCNPSSSVVGSSPHARGARRQL